jgi:hypothetical protein
VGGNKIEYAGNTSTPTTNLTTAKPVLNSVVSTPNAEFATGNISDFYLFTNINECEYMWILIQFLNPEVMAAYELDDIIVDKRVLAKGNVRPATGWTACLQSTCSQSRAKRIPSVQKTSRYVVPRYAPRPFFIGGRRFRN